MFSRDYSQLTLTVVWSAVLLEQISNFSVGEHSRSFNKKLLSLKGYEVDLLGFYLGEVCRILYM